MPVLTAVCIGLLALLCLVQALIIQRYRREAQALEKWYREAAERQRNFRHVKR